MEESRDSAGDEAVIAAFLALYLEDLQAEAVGSLEEYQARFPGFEESIAVEYRELTAPARPDESHEPSTVERFTGAGPRAGQPFGHYVVEKMLGRGAQGSVWRALDQHLGRPVALKVLSGAGMLSSDSIRRFQREGELAARLRHPHICEVYDSGIEDGLCYLAMRLVQGETLSMLFDQRREAGPPDAEWTRTIARIVEQLAEGLHYAHQAGVLHRDVKPGNILLDDGERPVLADFGLAKDVEGADISLTVEGGQLGTPAYMSAEQLSGGALPLDQRTDVFSLALVLYEGLTFERAYDGLTLTVVGGRAIRPRPRDVVRGNPHVSKDLRIVLAKAMAEDRAERYDTALAFADDLANIRLSRPISARPAGPLLRFRRWVRRSPVIAGFTLALIVLLGASLAMALYFLDQARSDAYLNNYLLAAAEADAGMTSAARANLDACPASLRGFEWHLLDAQLTPPDVRAELPTYWPTRGLVARPDGWVAVDGLGGWARCDPEGRVIAQDLGDSNGYGAAGVDRTGRFIANWRTLDGVSRFSFTDLETEQRIDLPADPGVGPNDRIAVARDRTVWLTRGADLLTWRPGEPAWTARVEGGPAPVEGLTLAEDGGLVATLWGGKLRVYDFAGRLLHTVSATDGWALNRFVLEADGRALVTTSEPSTGGATLLLERWELGPDTPRVSARSSWESLPANEMLLASSGHVVVATDDARLLVFSSDLRHRVAEHTGLERRATALATRGSELWTIDGHQRLIRWDLERPAGERRLAAKGENVCSLAFDPSGRWLAVAYQSGAVGIVDLEEREPSVEYAGQAGASLAWDASSEGFVALGRYNRALLIQPGRGATELFDEAALDAAPGKLDPERDRTLYWFAGEWRWVGWSGGTNVPFGAWSDARLTLDMEEYLGEQRWFLGWSGRDGLTLVDDRAQRIVRLPAGPAQRFAASADGRLLAGVFDSVTPDPDERRTIAFVDVDAGVLLPQRVALDGQIWCLDFSRDRRLLAVGTSRSQVKLVAIEDGQVLLNLATPSDPVEIGFAPGARHLCAGCLDGSVVIWEATTRAR